MKKKMKLISLGFAILTCLCVNFNKINVSATNVKYTSANNFLIHPLPLPFISFQINLLVNDKLNAALNDYKLKLEDLFVSAQFYGEKEPIHAPANVADDRQSMVFYFFKNKRPTAAYLSYYDGEKYMQITKLNITNLNDTNVNATNTQTPVQNVNYNSYTINVSVDTTLENFLRKNELEPKDLFVSAQFDDKKEPINVPAKVASDRKSMDFYFSTNRKPTTAKLTYLSGNDYVTIKSLNVEDFIITNVKSTNALLHQKQPNSVELTNELIKYLENTGNNADNKPFDFCLVDTINEDDIINIAAPNSNKFFYIRHTII